MTAGGYFQSTLKIVQLVFLVTEMDGVDVVGLRKCRISRCAMKKSRKRMRSVMHLQPTKGAAFGSSLSSIPAMKDVFLN